MVLILDNKSYEITGFSQIMNTDDIRGIIMVRNFNIFNELKEKDFSSFVIQLNEQDYTFTGYHFDSATEYYSDDIVRYEIILLK